MLSGRRPRGSNNTPVSGKIGMISGSGASRSLIAMPPSREHQRGQSPPRAERERVGRPHHLEKLDQLLAGGLLVPFAVALEQAQQFIDRLLALAGAEQRRRQLEPRLVVLRVLLQASLQLAGRAHRLLSLLGEFERRLRGR